MDIAITGATGLIGTALGAALRADGHRVVPVVRRRTHPGEDAVAWDPGAGRIDRSGLEGLDAVVHLAGAGIGDHRWTPEYKRTILQSRTEATALLAETLSRLDRPPATLVSGSAVGYYGERGDDVVTEEDPPGGGFLADVVVRWERAARAAAEAGIRVAHPRTGVVLTRRGGALAQLLPLFRLGLGGRMGSGRQWWSWITLDDEVNALRFLLDHDVIGPVNLTAPRPATNAELAEALGRVLHRPAVLPIPAFGPKLLKGAELAQELLFTSTRAVPHVLTQAGFTHQHPDLDDGLRAALERPAG